MFSGVEHHICKFSVTHTHFIQRTRTSHFHTQIQFKHTKVAHIFCLSLIMTSKTDHSSIELWIINASDAQIDMLAQGASTCCVQKLDDSLTFVIHITFRKLLCFSSEQEPRDPLSKVVFMCKGKWRSAEKRKFWTNQTHCLRPRCRQQLMTYNGQYINLVFAMTYKDWDSYSSQCQECGKHHCTMPNGRLVKKFALNQAQGWALIMCNVWGPEHRPE